MTDDFRNEVLDQATAGVGVLDETRRAVERQATALEQMAAAAVEAARRERAVKGDQGDKGDTGEQGIQGIQGEQGPKGTDGEPGPAGADGATGERGLRGFQGNAGVAGPPGRAGEPGTDGRTVLNGDGPPSDRRGKGDDWYIDRLAKTIYGPKGPDGWGEPTSLKGPPGQSVTAGGFGGGGGQQVIYDDGVRIGVARDIDFQGGDAITIDHGIARVPVGSGGGGGGADLSDDTPLVESGAGNAGVGTEASRDDHVHPALAAASEWVEYTPLWTTDGNPPDIGNGTLRGVYLAVPNGDGTYTLDVQISLVAGSTTDFGTGVWRFSQPPPLDGFNSWTGDATGNIYGQAQGITITFRGIVIGSGDGLFPYADHVDVADIADPTVATGEDVANKLNALLAALRGSAPLTATSPGVWQSGDYFAATFRSLMIED